MSHNGRDGVSNRQPHHCLLNRLFRRRSKKYQCSTPLAFVWGIHRSPVNSPHIWPVTRKMCPFDDVIMWLQMMPADQRERMKSCHSCWYFDIFAFNISLDTCGRGRWVTDELLFVCRKQVVAVVTSYFKRHLDKGTKSNTSLSYFS